MLYELNRCSRQSIAVQSTSSQERRNLAGAAAATECTPPPPPTRLHGILEYTQFCGSGYKSASSVRAARMLLSYRSLIGVMYYSATPTAERLDHSTTAADDDDDDDDDCNEGGVQQIPVRTPRRSSNWHAVHQPNYTALLTCATGPPSRRPRSAGSQQRRPPPPRG